MIKLFKGNIKLYHIMQIVRSGKLSRFLQISLQSRMFSSENFISCYKVFLEFKMPDSGPGLWSWPIKIFQTVTAYRSLGLPTYKSLARSPRKGVSNYLDRHGNLECN